MTGRPKGQKVDPLNDPETCGYHGGRNKRGLPCGYFAMAGTQRCHIHAGIFKTKHKAIGEVNQVLRELERWGFNDKTIDPGELILRLMTQSWWRAERLADELARIVGKHEHLVDALTGDTYSVSETGVPVKTGEYVRAMTKLEAEERDRCMSYATKAKAAGLADRHIKVLEDQVQLFSDALRASLRDAGIDDEQQQNVISGVGRHLRLTA